MTDVQVEEFHTFPKPPLHCYRLVHDVTTDVLCDEEPESTTDNRWHMKKRDSALALWLSGTISPQENGYCDNIFPLDLRSSLFSLKTSHWFRPFGERRRRKLPEIPKNKTPLLSLKQQSLADEISDAERIEKRVQSQLPHSVVVELTHKDRPVLVLRSRPDDESSSESDRIALEKDNDSGTSTIHSPDGTKSSSINTCSGSWSPTSSCGGIAFSQLELLDATHRGLYKFLPRHPDEIEIEIGDAVYVMKEADDLWCEGVNLRTGRQGIFPAAHVTDVEYSEFDPSATKVKKERYLLNYLGSIETLHHKGNAVLCQAVRKIQRGDGESIRAANACILEISDQGIRMLDKSKPVVNDYFYSLKHISFCGFHAEDHRYFGFITKHPTLQRFACHVYMAEESTRPVAEAVGRAFQRFYQKFIETAYPIEEIYMEN